MECSVGWYLWRKEQSLETQEPEPEPEKCSQAEGDCSSPSLLLPLPKMLRYEPPVPWYKGPRCFQDQNPLELANGSEPEKEVNDPQCLEELYRNLLKEYRSRTQDPPLPPLLPPPRSPQPSPPLPPTRSVEPATTNDLDNNRPTSPTW